MTKRKVPYHLAFLVSVVFLMGLAAHPPIDVARANILPSWKAPLGTDSLGRDVLALSAIAFRNSLLSVALVVAVDLVFGCLLGFFSAIRYGCFEDLGITFVAETLRSFPGVLFVLLIATFGGGLSITLASLFWIPFWRQTRRDLRDEIGRDYYWAALALGRSKWSTVFWHCGRNVLPAMEALLLAVACEVFAAQCALELLGFGVGIDRPSVGGLLLDGLQHSLDMPWKWMPTLVMFGGLIVWLRIIAKSISACVGP